MKISSKSISFILALLMLSACGTDQPAEPPSEQSDSVIEKHAVAEESVEFEPASRAEGDYLSQKVAQSRKNRINNLAYKMTIDLVSLPDAYQGRVEMFFELKNHTQELTIDFTGGSVLSVVVNGQEVGVNYNGYFVTLPANSLQSGSNKVVVVYQHPYDQDGTGLHRFTDPEDGETYYYTYLWPYYANRLFPHFDQPNLKATYQMSVRADQKWQVISAAKESSIEVYKGDHVWHFPRTQKFSSYIFSLHAGPYKVWEDKAGEIPIRLLARKALAPYVPVEEWMNYTKMGLMHFDSYFGIAYPFDKYDQVLVPDFNIGAMENVAAVTFTDRLIIKGPSNRFQKQRRAGIILHEMAHMWFGNLVTKDWWNGLWLNESFATLMASIALAELPEFSDYWHDFYLNTNLIAIDADNLVSTHPIEVPVPSTNDFFAVFDSITYEKGASVLNQLSHFVGQENFRLGVSNYLKKHAWGNTHLADFIQAQAQQSGLELADWSKTWLYEAGVNRIEVNFTCEGENVSSFEISQTAPEQLPTLRNQKLQLALFDDAMNPYAVIPITISAENSEFPEVIGRSCPYLVYPNYQAWGYAEVELDGVSKINALNAISKSKDPMLRSMLWTSVLEDPSTSLEQVIIALDSEQNDRVINQVQNKLLELLNLMERQGKPQVSGISAQLEDLLWLKLNEPEGESNLRLIRLPAYFSVVRSELGRKNLLGLLDGSIVLPGMNLSQEHRWQIIHRLAVLNQPMIRDLINQEKANDPSDAGRLFAIAAEASLPNQKIKKAWLDQFMLNEDVLPLAHQRVAMGSLFPANQSELHETFLPDLLQALPMVADSRDNYYQRAYAQSLFAGICSTTAVSQMEAALKMEVIGTTLYRFLSENIQKAQECVAGIVEE